MFRNSKSDAEEYKRTAMAAAADARHGIAIHEAWHGRVSADEASEAQLLASDAAATAEPAPKPRAATAEEIAARGKPGSTFWAHLEQEDEAISESVRGNDGDSYSRLTQLESEQLAAADRQFAGAPATAQIAASMFEMGPLHDPFAAMEDHDKAEETKIRQDPELQMLQLRRRLRRPRAAA